MIPAVVIIGFVLIAGVAIYLVYVYEKKLTEKWQYAAEELGLSFLPEGDANTQNRLNRFELFNSGRARKMKNLIQGITDEVHLAIFDYRYTTGSGKHQQTHSQTVVFVESPQLVMPAFTMRAEGFFDKIGGVLGFQDIDFEEFPTFSGMYVLKGPNESAIRSFFSPEIIQFFESQPSVSVEGKNGALVFYQPQVRRKPEELKDLLTSAYEIYGAVVDSSAGKKPI